MEKTFNLHGEIKNLSEPMVSGILNVTKDSFFDGGRYVNEKTILLQAEKMINEGADFIDIGGQSTRPGAEFLTEEEELKKVIPVIKQIKKYFPKTRLSIDTFWSKVAIESVNEGAVMINDISAGTIDGKMFETMGKLQVPYVLMHIKGTPKTMQKNTEYKDLILDINYFFSEKIQELKTYGVNDILLDVGFGFSKTLEQNYELMKHLDKFQIFDLPLYVGISRKSMIYKLLETTPENVLPATSALNLYSLQKGAKMLRVHDVKEAKETIKLWKMLQ